MLTELASEGRFVAIDQLLTGPRGVGKTSLLTAYGNAARDQGYEVVTLQSTKGGSFFGASLLRHAEEMLSQGSSPWEKTRKAFERLSGVGLGGVSFSLTDKESEGAQPFSMDDPGPLARTLASLASNVQEERGRGGLLITVDELQTAHPSDLTLLAGALHRLNVDHPTAPVAFAASGLPNTMRTLIEAGVTHPDRLLDHQPIPVRLSAVDASKAIALPANKRGVYWHADALRAVVKVSNGYPAHVQIFAHAVWRQAPGPTAITMADAKEGIDHAGREISRRTLDPRWDLMTDRGKEYMAALSLNGGLASVKAMEATLGRPQREFTYVRDRLIEDGDIYSPQRGVVQVSMPLIAPYVIAKYESAREIATTKLLSLDTLRRNAKTPGQTND